QEWGRVYIKQRAQMLGVAGLQMFQVLLPEVLTNPEVRQAYMAQIIEPTYAMAETFFEQWVADGTVREMDPALTLRAISGMFMGVILLRLMGDEPLQTRWDEMPDIMAQIVLQGIEKQATES
ncbi:MAG: TetR/AcrR family transcriptional regulator C-terminal ligand-binding domain-containing protein, partial [Anaerolineae bacterium]|nr:TetR/AcrR family transcriptional regulator C-terminal ligand-binding domain-containing protein [Anaerolineae bacterium]